MSLSDELDCLSLTSSFSGASSMVKNRAPSSSRSPHRSAQPLTLLTKALPINPRNTIGWSTMFLNSPRTNGTPQLLLDLLSSQSHCHLLADCRVDLLSCSLRVAGSELGIKLGPEKIHPPFVCLFSTAVRTWGIDSLVACTWASRTT